MEGRCYSGLAVAVVPLHDFVIFLDLLFDVRQFVLQVVTSLFLLQKCWILEESYRNTGTIIIVSFYFYFDILQMVVIAVLLLLTKFCYN